MKTQIFKLLPAESYIVWVGRKVTGAHNGSVGVKWGEVLLTNDKLTGGIFVIDMTSLKVLDVTDPVTNAQFAGHLASDDFFSIEKYPEASLEITAVSRARADGNLTIKGITHPISFDTEITINGDTLLATGKMIIDRTKYGMKFRSGNFFKDLGDTLIYNDFELNISLIAKASTTDRVF
jgi:hypothetical protein